MPSNLKSVVAQCYCGGRRIIGSRDFCTKIYRHIDWYNGARETRREKFVRRGTQMAFGYLLGYVIMGGTAPELKATRLEIKRMSDETHEQQEKLVSELRSVSRLV